jgi:pimeloyl-ACP methyl ester carboxylesterase
VALVFATATAAFAGTMAAAEAQPPSGAYVAVEGGRIWYETCGSGPKAIMLIHDGVLHSARWDDVWPILCKDFHVVRYDRRGYGRSPAATAPYSPVDDLAAVMHAASVSHTVLVGSSSGGGLAVDFTLRHPEAVDWLVLVGPAVSGLAYSQYFIDRVTRLEQLLNKGDFDSAVRDSWCLAPGHDAARKQIVDLLRADPQDITHADPARPAPVAKPLLSTIKAPTLILVGEYDVADNQAQAGAIEALIPGSKRVVVRDTGHLMYLEHPDVFADLVERFAEGGRAR